MLLTDLPKDILVTIIDCLAMDLDMASISNLAKSCKSLYQLNNGASGVNYIFSDFVQELVPMYSDVSDQNTKHNIYKSVIDFCKSYRMGQKSCYINYGPPNINEPPENMNSIITRVKGFRDLDSFNIELQSGTCTDITWMQYLCGDVKNVVLRCPYLSTLVNKSPFLNRSVLANLT